jgi:tRNA A37 threonylcarbamoyladenosine dehydratase
MIDNRFIRSQVLLGETSLELLRYKCVLIAGLGGVGSWAVEALVRTGVGRVIIIDGDKVELSNINRQLFATEFALGLPKTDAARDRLLSINPNLEIIAEHIFLDQTNIEMIISKYHPDFVIDAIDTVSAKAELIAVCLNYNISIISCLGAALKKDPQQFIVTNLFTTTHCPLARALRQRLRRRYKIEKSAVPCIFSPENPYYSGHEVSGYDGKKFLGSYVCVVATAGLLAADYCLKTLLHTP